MKKGNWKKATSWKNWILLGAFGGFVFIFLFNLTFISINFLYFFEMRLSSIVFLIIYVANSLNITTLLYVFIGILMASIIKISKNKIKRKKQLIFITIVVLLTISIFWYLGPISLYSCSSKDPYLTNNCLKELAISKVDPNICYYITSYELDDIERRECFISAMTEKAANVGDEEMCLKLKTPGKSHSYYDVGECVKGVAIKNKDENACNVFEGDGFGRIWEECRRDVAILKTDLELCPDYFIEECYQKIISKSENPILLCKNLKTGGSLWNCYKNIDCSRSINFEECRLEVNRALNDPSLCELEETFDKIPCYADYAMRLNDPNLCDRGPLGFNGGTACRRALADINNNPNFCISDDLIIYGCILELVDKNDDINLCYKFIESEVSVEDQFQFDNCIYRQAYRHNNLTICQLAGTDDGRDTCTNNILYARRDGKLLEGNETIKK